MKSIVITIIVIFVLIVFYAIYRQSIPTELNTILIFVVSIFPPTMVGLNYVLKNLKEGKELKQEKPKLKFEVLSCSVGIGATFIEQDPNTYATGLYINLKLYQSNNNLSSEVFVPIELCQFTATIGDSEHKLDMSKWKSNAPDRIEITPHEIRFKGSGGIEYSGEIYGESEEPLFTLNLKTNYGQIITKEIRSEDYEENARWFGLSESGAFDEFEWFRE